MRRASYNLGISPKDVDRPAVDAKKKFLRRAKMNAIWWLLIILAIVVLLVWGLGAALSIVFWVIVIGLVLIGIWYLMNRNRVVVA